MKRVYITFGGQAYDPHTARVVETAHTFGVDELRVYDDRWLMGTEFYRANEWLWNWREKWGFGWNCWKAFIIRNALSEQSEPASVLYVDGDTYPVADLTPIFNFAERDGVCLFESQGNLNKRFTRRDVFRQMYADQEHYWDARHACGRFSIWSSSSITASQALHAWGVFLIDPLCQGWHASERGGDFPEFYRNSGDQSILTVLAERHGFPLHREACQFGWPPSIGHGQLEDTYPQLFVQSGDRAPDRLEGSCFQGIWSEGQRIGGL
jgi:hypothetical protein